MTTDGIPFFPVCFECDKKPSRVKKTVSTLKTKLYLKGYEAGRKESTNDMLGCIGFLFFTCVIVPFVAKITLEISDFLGIFGFISAPIFFGIIFGILKIFYAIKDRM